MENFPAWADHLLAWLVGIIIPVTTLRQHAQGFLSSPFDSTQKKSFYLSVSISLFTLALIVVGVWLLFKRPPEELGLRLSGNTGSWWWLVLIFVVLYILDTALAIGSPTNREKTSRQWRKTIPFMPTKSSEFPLYLLMCFSAGVFEEIIFRGFLVTYCFYLFAGVENQVAWAIIFPSVIFSVAHFYQGVKAILKIFILTCLFGYIFTQSGSLLIVMLLHFLVDLTGGLLTMRYLGREQKEDTGSLC